MATETPTLTPTVPPEPGINPIIVDCLDEIDTIMQPYVLSLDVDGQGALGCPAAPAETGPAQALIFEHGYMVAFDSTPEMLVVYWDSGEWERQFVPETGDEVPTDEAPGNDLHYPTGRFGYLWLQGDRGNELGYAVNPEPDPFVASVQPFPAALLVADRGTGEVAVLPLDRQR